jgi:hypothetical protein
MQSLTPDIESFIERWRAAGGSERANYQEFVRGLCAILGVDPPGPQTGDEARDHYVYERRVRKLDEDGGTVANFIDCYKHRCFVLEAKQSQKRARPEQAEMFPGAGQARPVWDRMMKAAKAQAERYARALPEWPPFLIVVDIGHVIELFADFTGLGKAYMPFPDARSHRIRLDDLADPAIRAMLATVWTAPWSLDPAAKRAGVTRDIAERLAILARSLERRHPPKLVAEFLIRCMFTAFADDVGLLRDGAFRRLLDEARPFPDQLPEFVDPLWRAMEIGQAFLKETRGPVRHFNGGLFRDARALPLTADELSELIVAVNKDWRDVEPAIFGTLVEHALDPVERARLGAEFTPRAYVERLVVPTVIEPLREDWAAAQAAAEFLRERDRAGAVREIRGFLDRLLNVRVLDPACGTGNFLYVALEHLKRLEAEVRLALEELGERAPERLDLAGETVGPHQMLGIEKNPRAVLIAEVVLWIGHLQWHLRHRTVDSLGEPILKPVHTIREGDAILAWGREEPVLGPDGRPLSRWDGRTWRDDPATGRRVPDETARVEVMRHRDPRPADPWPDADFIVGNPPFVAGKDLRQDLGDGYAEALWAAYPHLPGGADMVMVWWDRAADLVRAGKARRFGFISTNSITQVFSRRVIQRHQGAKPPLHLAFAIADHPWADGAGTAAVRIAMTVGTAVEGPGVLKTVQTEGVACGADGAVPVALDPTTGRIGADLTIGPDVVGAAELRANGRLSSRGVSLHGAGFIVSPAEARALGLGSVPGLEAHIRPYRNGRDLTGRPRGQMVIDLFGQDEADVRRRFPAVWQHVFDRVKPERDANNRETYRTNWWVFGEPRRELRPALAGLPRYIATVETAKHRMFQFLDAAILPDNMLVAIALPDAWALGVLSSRIHAAWALAAGGWLGQGNDPRYQKSRCFDAFPFPILTPAQMLEIGAMAEELDAHRKAVLAEHAGTLTLTDLYNALAARRENRAMTDKEATADRLGSVGVLKRLHDMIDAAVAAAYGWPAHLSDAAVLERVVHLNAARAREEAEGLVRWLRPAYQNPHDRRAAAQLSAVLDDAAAPVAARLWPRGLPDQMAALPAILARSGRAMTAAEIARGFRGARAPRVRELLAGLAAVGQVRRLDGDRFAA